MRNLYKAIGASPKASLSELMRCLAAVSNRSMAEATQRVLLNERAKAIYDSSHRTVETIALLRARMCISPSESWTQIGLPDYHVPSQYVAPTSGKNGRAAPEKAEEVPEHQRKAEESSDKSLGLFCAIVVLILGGIGVVKLQEHLRAPKKVSEPVAVASPTHSHARPSAPPPAVNPVNPKPILVELAFPNHGVVEQLAPGPYVAPLTIKTSAGGYYYIKLVPIGSKLPAMIFYVHGGRSVGIKVPIGRYELKYASGSQWYGEKVLFGPGTTVYSRADATFDFRETTTGYAGYTVELIKQINGNLETQSISPESF